MFSFVTIINAWAFTHNRFTHYLVELHLQIVVGMVHGRDDHNEIKLSIVAYLGPGLHHAVADRAGRVSTGRSTRPQLHRRPELPLAVLLSDALFVHLLFLSGADELAPRSFEVEGCIHYTVVLPRWYAFRMQNIMTWTTKISEGEKKPPCSR